MEAVGNFVLVFAFGIAIVVHNWCAPLIIGSALVGIVYSRSRVPAGHFNPALTLAMLIRGRLGVREALALWLVQVAAGLLAAATVRAIVDPTQLAFTAAMNLRDLNLVAALAVEIVCTCALCYVALEASTAGNSTAADYDGWPIVIGMIASAVAVGAITNGAILSLPTLWVYLVSQLLSGIATAITFIVAVDNQ